MEINAIQSSYYQNPAPAQNMIMGAAVQNVKAETIDTKQSLQVHNTEKVEHTTETKQIFKTDNILSLYKTSASELNCDFYKIYLGLNIR